MCIVGLHTEITFCQHFAQTRSVFFFGAHGFLSSRLQPESVGAVGLWRGDVRAALQTLRRKRGPSSVQDLDHLCLSHARRPPHSEQR